MNQAAPLPPLAPAAQQMISLMREEAHTYRQPLVGTEHLLLGLIRAPGAAARVLAAFDVTLPRAHDAVELLAGHGARRPASDSPLNLTQRTLDVFLLADRLRRALDQAAVDTAHLLLALLDIPGSAAHGVLQTLGVEREYIRTSVLATLGGPPPLPTSEQPNAAQLTHLDARGQARMVDVGDKASTAREAIARGTVVMQPETLRLITSGEAAKGDVLATARIAGIMAAKHTSSLIPLCHPLMLTHVSVNLTPDEPYNAVQIEAIVRTAGQTGVEMEALTAVSVAALTIYDMCKAVDRGMRITDVRLAEKRGGKSGEIVLE